MKDEENILQPSEDKSQINMEVEFVDPNPIHKTSLEYFLVNYLNKMQYPHENLAQIITNQISIGTMVVQSGETDVFAFATILNIAKLRDQPSIKSVFKFINETSSKYMAKEDKDKLLSYLESKKVGLLINERVINFPSAGIPTLHEMVKKDFEWTMTRPDVIDKESYNFEYLLYITTLSRTIGDISKKKQSDYDSLIEEDAVLTKV